MLEMLTRPAVPVMPPEIDPLEPMPWPNPAPAPDTIAEPEPQPDTEAQPLSDPDPVSPLWPEQIPNGPEPASRRVWTTTPTRQYRILGR